MTYRQLHSFTCQTLQAVVWAYQHACVLGLTTCAGPLMRLGFDAWCVHESITAMHVSDRQCSCIIIVSCPAWQLSLKRQLLAMGGEWRWVSPGGLVTPLLYGLLWECAFDLPMPTW
jgi:hypothetical protein